MFCCFDNMMYYVIFLNVMCIFAFCVFCLRENIPNMIQPERKKNNEVKAKKEEFIKEEARTWIVANTSDNCNV